MKTVYLLAITAFAVSTVGAMAPNTQSLSKFAYNGASVLPYTRWKPKSSGGKAYFLLARESHGSDKGTFDAFGGGREKLETHPVTTAAREFAEETIGLMGSEKAVRKYIDLDTGNTSSVIANIQKELAVYITKFDPKTLEGFVADFYTARANSKKANQKEKDQLAWVSWQNLADTIAQAPRDAQGKLITPIQVWANVIDANGKKNAEQITLRPCFVSSLQSFFAGAKPAMLGKNSKIKFYTR